jgi:hypothetical protein
MRETEGRRIFLHAFQKHFAMPGIQMQLRAQTLIMPYRQCLRNDPGSDTAEQRQAAVECFQDDADVSVAVCNLIAGGVGITLTGGTHILFQALGWVPANHAHAEDRCYRLGQKKRVTVEYFYAAGSLDEYVSELLSLKTALIGSVEAEVAPDASFLADLEARLRAIAPAPIEEAKPVKSDPMDRLAELTALLTNAHREQEAADNPGLWQLKSSRIRRNHTRSRTVEPDISRARAKDFSIAGTASTSGPYQRISDRNVCTG